MKTMHKTQSTGLPVQTNLKAGYWTCTGVKGNQNKKGVFTSNVTADLCYKPKYAPIFGAPAFPGGDEP